MNLEGRVKRGEEGGASCVAVGAKDAIVSAEHAYSSVSWGHSGCPLRYAVPISTVNFVQRA